MANLLGFVLTAASRVARYTSASLDFKAPSFQQEHKSVPSALVSFSVWIFVAAWSSARSLQALYVFMSKS